MNNNYNPFDNNNYHNNETNYNDSENKAWHNPYEDSSPQQHVYSTSFNPNVNQSAYQNYNKVHTQTTTYPQKSQSISIKAFIFIMVSLIIIAIIGSAIYYSPLSSRINHLSGGKLPISSEAITMNLKDATEDENNLSAREIYKKVEKAIVGIVVYDTNSDLLSNSVGQGSGIIISENGYIVTNSHVIGNSKAYKVSVVTNANNDTETKEYDAKVVGFDTRTDLAVLKIEETNLSYAEFGNSDQLEVGASVLAIGNPGGLDFANSLTRGIVSAINRTISSRSVKYIQTDATINMGNSGGALLDMYGRVIGITSNKIAAEGFEGMGFAIPSSTVKNVVDAITAKGYVSGRACLGMEYQDFSATKAQLYQVPKGVIVKNIVSGSNLSNAGIKVGDIITAIDNTDICDSHSLAKVISEHQANDTVKISVYRKGSSYRLVAPSSQTFSANVALIEDKGEHENVL